MKPTESLVGVKQLPSAKALAREIIQINRPFGSWPSAPGTLEYELRPDNSLSITHAKVDRDFHRLVVGQETLHLSAEAASKARHMLWRFRPEILQGIEVEIRPTGCPPPPIDASPQFFVDFISEGPKTGIADDKLGVVFIPYTNDCRTGRAAEAGKVVRAVLQSFPSSKVVAQFDRDVSRWNGQMGR